MTDNERTYEPENQKQLFDLCSFAKEVRKEISEKERAYRARKGDNNANPNPNR